MPKKAGMEAWKKSVGRNIWRKKNSGTISSAKVSRPSHYILRDLSDVLKTIQFIEIWCLLK